MNVCFFGLVESGNMFTDSNLPMMCVAVLDSRDFVVQLEI